MPLAVIAQPTGDGHRHSIKLMQLFAVHEDNGDIPFPGYISAWRCYDDAYAAAGEAQAMDPEATYSVHTIEEEEFQDFWFHNLHLTLA
jgi:hypothetical protein